MNLGQGVHFCKLAQHDSALVRKVYRNLLTMNFAKHPKKDEILERIFTEKDLPEQLLALWCQEADTYMNKFVMNASMDEATKFITELMDDTVENWSDLSDEQE